MDFPHPGSDQLKPQPPAFDLQAHRARLASLAAQGVYVGTSSWKYRGWCGLVYDEQRYLTRSKFSEAKFEQTCLAEYAETYKTACVDAAYYQFPTAAYLAGLCAQVPSDFKFALKVTDTITVKRFPALPRFGARAGTTNSNFLNAELFWEKFLKPCEQIRAQVGPLIFEFSTFHTGEFEHGRDFVASLDRFLEALPRGWEYAVELRNPSWLQPEYFSMLQAHGVAHVFNSWTDMPPVAEQLKLAGSTPAPFTVARFLLEPGQKYQAAVKAFQPYSELKAPNEAARTAAGTILEQSLQRKRKGYLYVNNRLEGCAPLTIAGFLPKAG